MVADFRPGHSLQNQDNSNAGDGDLLCAVSHEQGNSNGLEPQLHMTVSYLINFHVDHLNVSKRTRVWRDVKEFAM